MPYSRATIAACEAVPPVSTTTATARWKSGVQAGFVTGAISTSPARSFPNSDTSWTIFAGPVATPGLPDVPLKRTSFACAWGVAVRRRGSIIGLFAKLARLAFLRATSEWISSIVCCDRGHDSQRDSSSLNCKWNTSSTSSSAPASTSRLPSSSATRRIVGCTIVA